MSPGCRRCSFITWEKTQAKPSTAQPAHPEVVRELRELLDIVVGSAPNDVPVKIEKS